MSQAEPTVIHPTAEVAPSPPPDPPVSPDPGDGGVEYLDSGRVRMRVGSQEFVLRPPLFGELKAYRKALARVDEDAQSVVNEILAGTREPGDEQVAFVDGIFAVVAELVHTLTGRTLPPQEECPIWLGSPNLSQGLTRHWQTVPLLSGETPRI